MTIVPTGCAHLTSPDERVCAPWVQRGPRRQCGLGVTFL